MQSKIDFSQFEGPNGFSELTEDSDADSNTTLQKENNFEYYQNRQNLKTDIAHNHYGNQFQASS